MRTKKIIKILETVIPSLLRKVLKEKSVIIGQTPPTSSSIAEKEDIWMHGNDMYIAKEVKVKWEKQNKKDLK